MSNNSESSYREQIIAISLGAKAEYLASQVMKETSAESLSLQ
ncbi:MAG: hypothetical protein V2B18_03785 [Pseudomonadota bacterium]